MTLKQYQESEKYLLDLAEKTRNEKRPGYTQESEDVLFNFKQVAEQSGLTPLQVWNVYFLKHIIAIQAYVKNPDMQLPESEPIDGRFADAVNYLLLGNAILDDMYGAPEVDEK